MKEKEIEQYLIDHPEAMVDGRAFMDLILKILEEKNHNENIGCSDSDSCPTCHD